jgi:hypothetical protein
MTKYKLSASVPTNYQINSLRAFGLEIQKLPNGTYYGERIFDSEKEAKDFLIERAESFFDGNSDNDFERLADAIDRIQSNGSLWLDAAYGSVEEFETITN